MSNDRDFNAEMNAFIDEVLGVAPFVAAVAAEKTVAKLREQDVELLTGWLDTNAEQFIREEITARDRAVRRHIRQSANTRRFADAADSHDEGDDTPLSQFLTMPLTVEDGLRKRLTDMNAADLQFSAEHYRQRETDNRMMKVFLLALKKKVGKQTVGDVFDETTLAAMWRSITSGKAA
jgi:predicted ferric reductase